MRLYLAVTLCQTVSGGSLVLGFPEISIFVPIDIPALIFSSLPSGASMLYASFCLHLFCCFVFIIWYFSFSYSLKNVFKQINFCGMSLDKGISAGNLFSLTHLGRGNIA